jgi:hypothetical protein
MEQVSEVEVAVHSPVRKGNKVLIRTVTHYHTGIIESFSKDEIVLAQACWIADTGRWSHCLEQGASVFREVEPYPWSEEDPSKRCYCTVNRGAIVDVQDWLHDLPVVTQ